VSTTAVPSSIGPVTDSPWTSRPVARPTTGIASAKGTTRSAWYRLSSSDQAPIATTVASSTE